MTATKPPPKPPAPIRHAGKCHAKCSGGNPCAANGRYHHVIHCCKEPGCACRAALRGKVGR